MTLRLRVLASFLVAMVGMIVASVQIASVLHQAHGADRALTTTWAPADTAASQLVVHLADQETAERGYVITRNDAFLQTYDEQRDLVQSDLARLQSTLGSGPAFAADLAGVRQRWQQWINQVAEPEILATKAGDVATSQRLVAAELDDQVFASLWSKLSALQQRISAQTAYEQQRDSAAIERLNRAFLATLVGVGILIILFSLSIQVLILRPLFRLQDELRRATAGAFREPIAATGPPELREVAADVELLRGRLVRELEQSESARQALEQRGTVVLGLSERLSLHDRTPIPGLRVASALHAAEGVVAGDVLDVIAVDERHVAVLIADVSGHGAVAGLEAISLKHVVATTLRLGHDPALALDMAADQPRIDERFSTCAVVVIDVVTGALRFANAGHLPPLIVPASDPVRPGVDPARLRTLEPTGPLVSALTRGWVVGHDYLAPGELLLLVTDGLIEARSRAGEEFGVPGVCKALARVGVDDVDSVVATLTAAVREHAENYSRDDVTVLAVSRDPSTAPAEAPTGVEPPAAAAGDAGTTITLRLHPRVGLDAARKSH